VHGQGFRLARPPQIAPRIVLAALGPRMQALAAAEADGVVLNFVSPEDVGTIRSRSAGVPREAAAPLEISARVFIVPGEGPAADTAARRHIAGYLTVPVYAQFQTWLGRGDALAEMQQAWSEGDRKKATAVLPEQVVRDLVIYGSPSECAKGVRRYLDAGLDAITLYLLPSPGSELTGEQRVGFLAELAGTL
jgi:alkanesulfonate monooxygenase SsuD/methylene tetrahydromethanopterin reductase-like flavin-dependent oxidoreductase (luciferase family)